MITYKSAMPIMSLKYTPSEYKKVQVKASLHLFQVFKEHFDQDTMEYREEMLVVYLNSANNTIGLSSHSKGGTGGTLVEPKIILTEALLCGASSIAIAHNHPSSQLFPSTEDAKITSRIKAACDYIGIRFLDHLIISGDKSGYYSFADEGRI